MLLETDSLRLEVGQDGTLRGLAAKPEIKEYAWTVEPGPIAMVYRGGRAVPASSGKYAASTGRWVYRGGQSFPASRVDLAGGKLTIEFGEANATATYRVIVRPHYLAFELIGLEGDSVDRIDLVRLNVKRLPHLGTWVNAACDDRFGICLCAGNIKTNAEMDQHAGHVTLRATAEKEVGIRGTTAVLFGFRDPQAKFLDAMAIVERDFDMPAGAENRRLPGQRFSYLWASPTPENITEYIHWARRGGFRMIVFSYTAFSTGAGHFDWNGNYPRGMTDLKRVTGAVRQAGLKLGLHIHYSKAHKRDRYVTPIPDDRLNKVRHFTLAADIDGEAETIRVSQTPEGCTLDEGRQILQAGGELIAYRRYSTEPAFQFTGCQRGILGTTASGHRKGEPLGLLDVDTWPAFIRYDQGTDIQDETARRIAEIFHQTGPYDMVYFDGAEDVHEPFWYHVASAQYRVLRNLQPVPPVCEAPHYTHFSWHFVTRSNAYDIVAPAGGMKDFCRLMPCPTAVARAKDFSRIDFGWLGRFGKDKRGYAGPDVWEYVASRAAAWDCPLSMKATLDEIASNPRRDDCLEVIRTWEDARLGNHLTREQRQMLKNVPPEHARYVPCYEQREIWKNFCADRNLTAAQRQILADRQEHHLFINESGQYELVPIVEIPDVAGGAVKTYQFHRAHRPSDTHFLVWAVQDDVSLRLPVTPRRMLLMRPFGNRLPVNGSTSEALVNIGNRAYLVLIGLDAEQGKRILDQVHVVPSATRGS